MHDSGSPHTLPGLGLEEVFPVKSKQPSLFLVVVVGEEVQQPHRRNTIKFRNIASVGTRGTFKG
jgi:hypothetical protein